VILSSIELADDPNTEGGIEKLLEDFGDDSRIGEVVYKVAGELNWKNDAKAKELYEEIVRRQPASDSAAQAKVKLASLKMRGGDDEGAKADFEKIVAEYRGRAILSKVMRGVAGAYWDLAIVEHREKELAKADSHFSQCLEVCTRMIEEPVDAPYHVPWAYTRIAEYGRICRDYPAAIAAYKIVAEGWPEFHMAGHAENMITELSRQLRIAQEMNQLNR